MPPLSDLDHEERRHYLGGTDLAAIVGVSRWGSPLTVFADKRPDIWTPAERTTSPMMEMGHLIEPVVATVAGAIPGLAGSVRQPPLRPSRWIVGRKTRAVPCPDHPWEGANVDRIVGPDLLECKWGESRRRWGDMTAARSAPVDDHPPARPPVIPEDYFVQVQHYLHVTGRRQAIVGLLLGYADFRWYRIVPEVDLIAAMVERAAQYWADHIVPGIPPEPDGTPVSEARLRVLYPRDAGTQRPATPGEASLLRDYRRAIELRDTAALTVEAIKQRLMASLGTTTRVDAPGVSVTWKQNRDGKSTKWADVVSAIEAEVARLNLPVDVAAIVGAHTSPTSGARPFVVTFSDDEEEADAQP